MAAQNPGLGAYSIVHANLIGACTHEHTTVASALTCFTEEKVKATSLAGSVSLRENGANAPALVPILKTISEVEAVMKLPEAIVFLTPKKTTQAEVPLLTSMDQMEQMQAEIGSTEDLADSDPLTL